MKQALVLNESEFKRVIAIVRNGQHAARNEVALCLSYWAGLRVCEIASLTISDVYEHDGKVRTCVALTNRQTKGSEGRQFILSNRLKRLLEQYRSHITHIDTGKPLIPSQKSGKHFSANSLCQLFGRIYQRTGIAGASSHSGRRTFITKLANRSVNAKVIMSLAGHKHLGTTQRYIEVNQQQLIGRILRN